MDLNNVEGSGDVEDRRGNKKAVALGGGLLGGGIGAMLIVLIAGYLGVNPKLLQGLIGGAGQQQQVQQGDAPKDGYKEFSSKILHSCNVVWKSEFAKMGKQYSPPKMVLFSNEVSTGGCGNAPSSVGPFYCPADKTVYLDPTFFDTLEKQLGGSKAEFSQAYVIGHEVGHHVQNLLGYNRRVEELRRREGENAGCRLELQADYLAGVWARHADEKYKIISSESEVVEALKTAKSIGDDVLQKRAQGWTSPEKYNHGTAEQRTYFFRRGYETGDSSIRTLDKFFYSEIPPLSLGKNSGI